MINAARVLTVRSDSQAAHTNMARFRQDWDQAVLVLTETVDSVVTIQDFLAVSEKHILEDMKAVCIAVRERDSVSLTNTASSVEARTVRITEVVKAEMEKSEAGLYTQTVLEAVRQLQSSLVPQFVLQVEETVRALELDQSDSLEESKLVEASRLLYDGVRHLSAISSQEAELSEDQSESEDLSEERSKILEKLEEIKTEKNRFEVEIGKWDEKDNRLIVLAKVMLKIMLEMTDFTEGLGPITSSLEMIRAAQMISQAGSQLDKVARVVAEQCGETRTRQDLLAYLQRIALYCHQLNICSKVKSEMRYSEGATSLLQAAKNLLSSVILTVRCCYVASTTGQYKQPANNQPALVWRIRRNQGEHEDIRREQEEEEEETAQSLGREFRGSIRRGNYFYRYKPIFRAQF